MGAAWRKNRVPMENRKRKEESAMSRREEKKGGPPWMSNRTCENLFVSGEKEALDRLGCRGSKIQSVVLHISLLRSNLNSRHFDHESVQLNSSSI